MPTDFRPFPRQDLTATDTTTVLEWDVARDSVISVQIDDSGAAGSWAATFYRANTSGATPRDGLETAVVITSASSSKMTPAIDCSGFSRLKCKLTAAGSSGTLKLYAHAKSDR
jgi:hypothetical protein